MHNGGAYRHCGIHSPPPALGGEFGHGEGYGYYGGRYGGGYDDLPLGRHPSGAAYGGFSVLRRHGLLGGYCAWTWNGYEQQRCRAW